MDEQEKQRLKLERAQKRKKARRARTALRKLKKAKQGLEKLGEISDWEEEFSDSVEDRLEKYGSAFNDPQKGAPSEALSNLQKQVLAQMRRKVRDKGKQAPKHSSFKDKSGFTPRVRNIEDDMVDEGTPPPKSKPNLRIIKGGKD